MEKSLGYGQNSFLASTLQPLGNALLSAVQSFDIKPKTLVSKRKIYK